MRGITVRRFAGVTALTLAVLALAAGASTARADEAAVAVPSAGEAVAAAVAQDGAAYAGDCAGTVSPRDAGKVCSKLVDERDGMKAYLVGRTFSEFARWVFVAPSADGWRVVLTTALDPFASDVPWPA